MCGYIGKISRENFDTRNFENANEHLICRGPDSQKFLNGQMNKDLKMNGEEYFSFIFNRLSIIDLSDKAMQPMISKENKSIILFNGEIYNHRELKNYLISKGCTFKTDHSDTEVLLNGFSVFGPDFVQKLIGQFSIVFYNSNIKKLYLIRDRVGQKPLYYKKTKNSISFSSNLKSLLTIEKTISLDNDQIINYLNFGVVSSPKSIFQDINKLDPGCVLEVDMNSEIYKFNINQYWKIEDFIDTKKLDTDEFINTFRSSVELRLESDVPVANFASGGLDSTSIIKAQNDLNKNEINTFSVSNFEKKYDESRWINEVVSKYSTNHTEHELDSKVSQEVIFESIDLFDEPYADPSTIPSYILSKSIASSYKVAISGDGGDELLGGYDRLRIQLKKKNLLLSSISNFYKIYPSFIGSGNIFLRQSNETNISYPSYFEDIKLLSLLNLEPKTRFSDKFLIDIDDEYKKLLISDYKFYLYEMMTHKIDRTSMASSLEVRSPFLDHRLIELIMKTDSRTFINSSPKNILKDYLRMDFNKEFINRKKQGFVFNLEGWIFKNINLIENQINNGNYVKSLNKNVIRSLCINKSRINGHRIWKLFFLERYLSNLNM